MLNNILENKLIALDIEEDLVKVSADFAIQLLSDEINKVNVIFPNRRAVRFFERFLNEKAVLRVEAYSMPDFVKNTVYKKSKENYFYQQEIDRYFFILKIIKQQLPYLYKKLGDKEDRVFPWCIKISKVFDNFDKELLNNIKKVEYLDNVVIEAKEILQQLDVLYSFYRKQMEENNLTFSGDLFRKIDKVRLNKNIGYIFSGFVDFTKGEKRFVKKVIDNYKSLILFQTDLNNRHDNFMPYEIFENWINGKYWGMKPHLLKLGEVSKNKISFNESFDLHSSCQQFNTQLIDSTSSLSENNPLNTAVVLPDEQSLIPVINSMNEVSLNITMGFPFAKSIISQILKNFINLSRTFTDKGYYHKPLLNLLNNKLIRNLEIDGYNFEKLFKIIANYIEIEAMPFIQFEKILNLSDNDYSKLKVFENSILKPFINANSLLKIGTVFQLILVYLENFLKDNEEYKLERQISENFIDSFLFKISEAENSTEIFENKEIIYSVLLSVVDNISIMFEGNPLKGIQIMGMLEARMLKFENLYIFDVNEGILPPDNKIDPLIPDIIKSDIGIKTYSDNLKKYKYYFYRLVDSCKNVNIFFQKGENNEEKKIRSRFVEQLLFEIEHEKFKNNSNLKVKELESSLISVSNISVSSNLKDNLLKKVTKRIKLNLKEKTISASFINNYMFCPMRFCFSEIFKICEEIKISETQDPRNIGDIVHKVLETILKDYKLIELDYKIIKEMKEKVNDKIIFEIEKQMYQLSKIRKTLLKDTAVFRMDSYFKKLYLESKESSIIFVDFEKGLNMKFQDYKFYGVVDRIDLIENSIEKFYKVVDYKTGVSADTPIKRINQFLEGFDFSDHSKENQNLLFKRLKSIQLPLYNYMLSKSELFNIDYDEIKSSLHFLGASENDEYEKMFEGNQLKLSYFENILNYILICIENVDEYYFNDTSTCVYCPHFKSCMFTSHTKN